MKLLLAAVLMLSVSCTGSSPAKAVCQIETSMASGLSTAISTTLKCKHPEIIQADLLAGLGSANLCAPKGVIGAVACPIVINAALALMAKKIPASWDCSPEAATATLSGILSTACAAIIPI